MAVDCYTTLGLDRSAPDELIDKAYRILARRFHPDSGASADAAQFARVQQAYEALSDPVRRATYDASVIEAERSGSASSHDIYQLLPLRFEQAVSGGRISIARLTDAGPNSLDIDVPASVENGERLRIPGYGEPGANGQAGGDLVLIVAVETHRTFRRQGLDLYVEVPVPIDIAVLGGRIKAPTLDGPVEVDVPAGTSGGANLRVRAKGLHNPNGQHGDLFVVPRIKIPRAVADEARSLAGTDGAERKVDARVVLFDPLGNRREFAIHAAATLVGRKSPSDLIIPDTSVSRRHCQFELRDDKLWIHDVGSRNGTFVNRERADQVELKAGDVVTVGHAHFIVVIDGEPEDIKPTPSSLKEGIEAVEYMPIGAHAPAAGDPQQQADYAARLAELDEEERELQSIREEIDRDRERLNADKRALEEEREAVAAAPPSATDSPEPVVDEKAAAKLVEAESLVESLRSEVDRTQAELAEATGQATSQRDEVASLTGQLDALRRELSSKGEAAAGVAEAAAQAAAATAALAASRIELDGDRESLKSERAALDKERESLADQQQRFEAQQSETTARLDADRAELDQQREAFLATRQTADAAASDIDAQRTALEQTTQQLEADHAAVREQREQLEADRHQLDTDRRAVDETSAELEAAQSQLESDRAALDETRAAVDSDREALTTQREQVAAGQTALDAERERFAADHAEFDSARAELDAARTALDSQRDQLVEQGDDLTRQTEALAETRADLETQRRSLDTEREAFEAERAAVESARAAIDTDRGEIDKNRLAIEEAEAALRTSAADLERRTAELDDREGSVVDRETGLAERIESLEHRDQELASRESEIAAAREQSDHRAADLDRRAAEVEAAEQQVAEVHELETALRDRAASLESRTADLDDRESTLSAQREQLDAAANKLAAAEREAEQRIADLERRATQLVDHLSGLGRGANPPAAPVVPVPAAVVSEAPSDHDIEDDAPAQPPVEPKPEPVAEPSASRTGPAHFRFESSDAHLPIDVKPNHLRAASGYVDRKGHWHLFADFIDEKRGAAHTWNAEVRYYHSDNGGKWQWAQTPMPRGEWTGDPATSALDCFSTASPAVVVSGDTLLVFYAGRGGVDPEAKPSILAAPGEPGHLRSTIMLATCRVDADGSPAESFVHRGPVVEPGEGWDAMRVDQPTAVVVGDEVHLFYTGYDDARDLARRKLGYATAKLADLAFTKHPEPVLAVPGGGETPRVFAFENEFHLFYQHFDHMDAARWRHYVASDLPDFELRDANLFPGPNRKPGEVMVWLDATGRLLTPHQALVTAESRGVSQLLPFDLAVTGEPVGSGAPA